MELTKNIFFNTDKLVENSKVKISYTGKLFQEASESVILHYGFGQNWNNVKDVEMEKTDLGFQTEITLENGETCNLCFKNNNGVWDNNNGQNYIFPIEKISTDLVILGSENISLGKPNKLRKTYLWSKKIRLAVYKIITYIPKIISGNYKRKINHNEIG